MPKLYKLTVSGTLEIPPEDFRVLEGLQGKDGEIARNRLALDELEENGKDLTVEVVELT